VENPENIMSSRNIESEEQGKMMEFLLQLSKILRSCIKIIE